METIVRAAADAGLAVRGAFHPDPLDEVPPFADGRAPGSLVLLGFVGREGWPVFAASAEARDGAPDPLDRWSRRVVDALAVHLGGFPLYPFSGPPWLPFGRWATRAEPVFPSPLGLSIHPGWGLWHSYRGAVALPDRLPLGQPEARPSPCITCFDRPCLRACPVGAFTGSSYRVDACAAHAGGPRGAPCREGGCLARRACPVGVDDAHGPDQARFLMGAFLAARS